MLKFSSFRGVNNMRKIFGITRSSDVKLGWVEREYPQLEEWRALAVEWLKGEMKGIRLRLETFVIFSKSTLLSMISIWIQNPF